MSCDLDAESHDRPAPANVSVLIIITNHGDRINIPASFMMENESVWEPTDPRAPTPLHCDLDVKSHDRPTPVTLRASISGSQHTAPQTPYNVHTILETLIL